MLAKPQDWWWSHYRRFRVRLAWSWYFATNDVGDRCQWCARHVWHQRKANVRGATMDACKARRGLKSWE